MAAIVEFNEETLEIKANLFLYGSQATNEIGQLIVDEISSMWNKPNFIYELNGKAYKVLFTIAYVLVDQKDIAILSANNYSFKNNFIRIEKTNITERSFLGTYLGDNAGHWLITDQLGKSTTAAHEFGHALGLPHPVNNDYRGKGQPPIMAPRGSIVDAQYQWEKDAVAGEIGGTMNPIHREVKDYEIKAVLDSLEFGSQTILEIGKPSNRLFDEVGNPIYLT